MGIPGSQGNPDVTVTAGTIRDTVSGGRISIEGRAGAPINVVLLAGPSFVGGLGGGNIVISDTLIRTFGGHVIMGGGNLVLDPTAGVADSLANATTTDRAVGGTSLLPEGGVLKATGVSLQSSYVDTATVPQQLTGFRRGGGSGTSPGAFSIGSVGSGAGGNVLIRGEGASSGTGQALGIYLRDGSSISTGTGGRIILDGVGGRAAAANPFAGCCQVASAGVAFDEKATLLAANADIVISARAGNGSHAYGLSFSEGSQLIRTDGEGRLLINTSYSAGPLSFNDGTPANANDNAVFIRDGLVTLDLGGTGDSQIAAPLVGGYQKALYVAKGKNIGIPAGFRGSYSFSKTGTGTLTLMGDVTIWNRTRPGGSVNTTFATKREGTTSSLSLTDDDFDGVLNDLSDPTLLLAPGLTAETALPAFILGAPLAEPARPLQTTFKFSQTVVENVKRSLLQATSTFAKGSAGVANAFKVSFTGLFKPKESYPVAKLPLFRKWDEAAVLKALKEGKMPQGANPALVKAALDKLVKGGDVEALQRINANPALAAAVTDVSGIGVRSLVNGARGAQRQAEAVNEAAKLKELMKTALKGGPLPPLVGDQAEMIAAALAARGRTDLLVKYEAQGSFTAVPAQFLRGYKEEGARRAAAKESAWKAASAKM
jgi:hypothetical protein